MFFYNTVEDPDWTAVLYAALIMIGISFIIFSLYWAMIQAAWSGVFIQFIFGCTLLYFGAAKLISHPKKADTAPSSTAPSDTAPSDTAPSDTAPSSTEPTIALTSEIHELHEPLNTSSDSDIIRYTLMIIAALFLIGFILVLIARKAIVAHKARTKLQRQIQHSRDTNVTQLREIMTAFTTESTNPANILKYQLYADAEHPANRAYVTSMMFAYKEQQDLDEAIAKYFKHNPEMISTHRFEKAVAETAKCWDMLNEAQQEAQRLITRQREAQQKAQRVVQRYVSSLQSLQSRIQEIDEIFNAAADAETQQDPNVAGTNGIT